MLYLENTQLPIFPPTNTAGVDYGTPNPSTFTFTAAQTIQCTNIPITDDALIEGPVDETFNITLTQTLPTDPGVQLGPTTAIVSIDDNDGKYCSNIHDLWYLVTYKLQYRPHFTHTTVREGYNCEAWNTSDACEYPESLNKFKENL